MEKIKAVGYIRVSTQDQADEGYSLEAQLEAIKGYCDTRNMEFVTCYEDRGVSGKSLKNRFGMQSLLEDAKEDRFQAVVTWKLSRMGRNLKNVLEFVDVFHANNVAFYSITENFEVSTSTGKFMLQIMASANELERNQISENVKLAMKKRARDGLWNGGAILGYDTIETEDGKKRLVPNETEREIIVKIFKLYDSGKGYRAIANQLNREVTVTKRGNSFSTLAIKDILTNPTYVGKIRYNRYEDWGDKRRKGLNKEPIIAQGLHEPIISETLYESVERKLKCNSKLPKWDKSGSNVLTGILRCPECDHAMAASNTTNTLKDGTKKRIRYYSCSQFRNKGASVCHANSIRADVAEKIVAEKLKLVVLKPYILDKIIAEMNQLFKQNKDMVQPQKILLEKTLKETETNIEQYLKIAQEAPNLLNELERQINKLRHEQDELKQELVQLSRLESQTALTVDSKYVKHLLKVLDVMLSKQDKPTIKAIYRSFIDKVTFNKEDKTMKVHLAFSQGVLDELEKYDEEELLPRCSSSFSVIL